MVAITGIVKEGRVEVDLPEGTTVRIEPVLDSDGVHPEYREWPATPEGIEEVIAELKRTMIPIKVDPVEAAELAAYRKAVREKGIEKMKRRMDQQQ